MMRARTWIASLALCAAAACGGQVKVATNGAADLAQLRNEARGSKDGETVGRWALYEVLAPGGDAAQADAARKRLDEVPHDGMYASLARALVDDVHGQPKAAAASYVAAMAAAQKSADPDAPLVAWFAVHNLRALRGSVSDLFAQNRKSFEAIMAKPESVGWRAASELHEWWAAEVFDKAEATGDAYDALVSTRLGCAKKARLAGPFGHGSTVDRHRSFPAEAPGPWPHAWAEDPLRGNVPHVLPVDQHRCIHSSTEATADGVFYAEAFFDTKSERELIVAVQGALKVWIDDVLVLERDPREWGAWQRYGAGVSLHEGRHRIVARVVTPAVGMRFLNLDGTAAEIETDTDASRAYSLEAPRVIAGVNPIDAIVKARATRSPIEALLASYAAHIDGMDDVASTLIEPLVKNADPGAVALVQASDCAQGDPALPDDARAREARLFREKAASKDKRLWYPRMTLILDQAEQRGPADVVAPLRALADEFKDVPHILEQLAKVYGRLGWRGERMQTLRELATRFPDDSSALGIYLEALEEDGALAEADAIATRIKRLDPDSEIDLDRALSRHDWKAAIDELRRLAKRRPDRKEIAGRIADVLARSGDPSAAAEQLTRALARQPHDSAARLRVADRAYAKGDARALRRALADALQVGANAAEIRAALDLLEGATDLEPYRIDGLRVIRDYEAWRKQGHEMEGTAARVLDYAATWVHADGSSEMLEHEIQRIQSQEAIGKEAEMQQPTGLVLRMRVLKKDGAILEPDQVAGKPTLTMPHLEVGDYIEIEHITPTPGDGQKGRRYRSPHWFFREAEKGYWRSAFIVVVPKEKKLEIETQGNVGEEKTKDLGAFVEHRWQVDLSPPAVLEPGSPPITEFLPSVRVGWGVTLDDWLARLVDAAEDETPMDPRLVTKAQEIVRAVPASSTDERARLLYRYVLEKVADGSKEGDGRRVLFGGAGSRQSAFLYLLRAVGIPAELAVVKNRLATPPKSGMSEIENYDGLLARLRTDKGVRFLLVRDKFAPFGYVPAEMRGQPCFRLVGKPQADTVSGTGAIDGVVYSGRADLRENGSAALDIAITFSGDRAIGARAEIDAIPETKLLEELEKKVIAGMFDGGHLRDVKVENKGSIDLPLVLKMRVEAPQLARPVGSNLVLRSIFPMDLTQLAQLPSRQTPLMRRGSYHTEVHFEVVVPEAMRMPASLGTGDVRHGDAVVVVKDAVNGHAIALERLIDLPAGRVQPGEDYTRYREFVRSADALLERDVLIGK
jgi:tetratricopeptide (TPR) repeat protein